MFCKFCGTQMNDGDLFCPNCGKQQRNESGSVSTAGTASTPQQVLLDKATPKKKPKKVLKILGIVMGVLILAFAVTFIVYLVPIKRDDKKREKIFSSAQSNNVAYMMELIDKEDDFIVCSTLLIGVANNNIDVVKAILTIRADLVNFEFPNYYIGVLGRYDTNNKIFFDGITALELAERKGYTEMAQLLRNAGATY